MISRLSGNPIIWAWSNTLKSESSNSSFKNTRSFIRSPVPLALESSISVRPSESLKGAVDGFEGCHCICGPRGGGGCGPDHWRGCLVTLGPLSQGGAGTMLLLTLLTGTFGFSESLMWLCERPALAEVRDERVPAAVQGCPVLVHWKLNASGGAIGSWACFVPRGMDNEASVSTCRTERWGSLSHLKRAQVTYLICPRQARDMIWSRGASSLNVLYRSFLISFLCCTTQSCSSQTLLSALLGASWKQPSKSIKRESEAPKWQQLSPRNTQ